MATQRLLFKNTAPILVRKLGLATAGSRAHLFPLPRLSISSPSRRFLATVTLLPPSKEDSQGAVGQAPQTTDKGLQHEGGVIGGEGKHFQDQRPVEVQKPYDLSDPTQFGNWTMMNRESDVDDKTLYI